jgi:hypothetical protein
MVSGDHSPPVAASAAAISLRSILAMSGWWVASKSICVARQAMGPALSKAVNTTSSENTWIWRSSSALLMAPASCLIWPFSPLRSNMAPSSVYWSRVRPV